MPIYLKIPNIEGEVRDARYEGWIAVESISFGRSGSAPQGNPAGTNRNPDPDALSTINITIMHGAASIKLFQAAAQGTPLGTIILAFDYGTPGGAHGFTMENTMISSYNLSGGGAEACPWMRFR